MRISRRPELIDQPAGKRSRRRPLKLEIVQIEPERSVGGPLDDLLDRPLKGRLSIRGQPHHLVLSLVHRKAEEGGARRIKHPQRVREVDLAEEPNLRTPALPPSSSDGQRSPLA